MEVRADVEEFFPRRESCGGYWGRWGVCLLFPFDGGREGGEIMIADNGGGIVVQIGVCNDTGTC